MHAPAPRCWKPARTSTWPRPAIPGPCWPPSPSWPTARSARAPQAALPAVPAETLTPREQQVLARAALGATAAQIAEDLHISPYTARKHRENLMRKLALHSTAELVAYAVRLGLPAA